MLLGLWSDRNDVFADSKTANKTLLKFLLLFFLHFIRQAKQECNLLQEHFHISAFNSLQRLLCVKKFVELLWATAVSTKNLSFTISTKRFSNQLTHETSSFWGKSVQKIDNNCKIWKWKVKILILLLPRKMILSVPFIFSSLCNVAWHPHQKKTRQVSQAWLICMEKARIRLMVRDL